MQLNTIHKASIYKIGIALMLVVVVISYLRWPLWPDHCLYMYMANLWRDGYLPYRDVFDQNWLGIVWMSQVIGKTFGQSPFAMRLFDVIWQFATCLFIYKLARRDSSQKQSLLPVFLYSALYLAASFGGTAQREGFASLLLGISLWFLYGRLGYAFLAGILIGLTVLIKPTLMVFLGLFAFNSALAVYHKEYADFKKSLLICLGISSVIVVYFAFLKSMGVLPDFIDAGLMFALRYSNLELSWILRRGVQFLIIYPPGRLLLVIIGLLILQRKNFRIFVADHSFLFLFVLGTFVSLFAQKRLAYYHAMPFCFFGSLFFLKLIQNKCHEKVAFGGVSLNKGVILLLLIFPFGYDLPKSLLSVVTLQQSSNYGDERRAERKRVSWRVITDVHEYIGANILKSTKLLVISGSDSPEYYFAANLPPLQKYVQPTHLIFDRKRLNGALSQIQQNKQASLILIDTEYKKLVPELFKVVDKMRTEAFQDRDVNKIFTKSYKWNQIEMYCVTPHNSGAKCIREND